MQAGRRTGKVRVAGPCGVDPDPDSKNEQKSDPNWDLTLKKTRICIKNLGNQQDQDPT